jgi:hypothetical protein
MLWNGEAFKRILLLENIVCVQRITFRSTDLTFVYGSSDQMLLALVDEFSVKLDEPPVESRLNTSSGGFWVS